MLHGWAALVLSSDKAQIATLQSRVEQLERQLQEVRGLLARRRVCEDVAELRVGEGVNFGIGAADGEVPPAWECG